MTYLVQWASLDGHMGMPRVEDLERDGWRVIGRDERYSSLLMRKDCEEGAQQ